MKNFVNTQSQVVRESIEGLLLHEDLVVLDQFPRIKVVVRKQWDKKKVALVSGGGSGHEPAHVGFIGQGMLTAVVCGQIFASPSVDAVLSAILAVTGESGCLLIVKNYTGDRLNFGLAAEQARALGLRVEMVVVADDVSIGDTPHKRGIAGTVFVHKIAGYYAELGNSLEQVAQISKKVAKQIYSIGLSIRQHSPFTQLQKHRLSENQAELGLGIHGEPGAKVIEYQTADEMMRFACEALAEKLPVTQSYALLLNNLGFVTAIEMNILLRAFTKNKLSKFVQYIIGPGHFMTALNMSGFSLSLLELNQETQTALLAPVKTPSWMPAKPLSLSHNYMISPQLPPLPKQGTENPQTKLIVEVVSRTLMAIEQEINGLDSMVGDGDTGSTLCGIARILISYSDNLPYNNLHHLLLTIGRLLARHTGGSMGVLLSIWLVSSSNAFSKEERLGACLLCGLKKMQDYGGGGRGSRTMVDALLPALEVLARNGSIMEMSEAARKGAESTKKIQKTQFGRSAYARADILRGICDPGAEAVARVFQELARLQI